MDKATTPSERIKTALEKGERSKAWLSRNTRIPLTTLDRKLRSDGTDLTLAQVHAIARALNIPLFDLIGASIPTAASA